MIFCINNDCFLIVKILTCFILALNCKITGKGCYFYVMWNKPHWIDTNTRACSHKYKCNERTNLETTMIKRLFSHLLKHREKLHFSFWVIYKWRHFLFTTYAWRHLLFPPFTLTKMNLFLLQQLLGNLVFQ